MKLIAARAPKLVFITSLLCIVRCNEYSSFVIFETIYAFTSLSIALRSFTAADFICETLPSTRTEFPQFHTHLVFRHNKVEVPIAAAYSAAPYLLAKYSSASIQNFVFNAGSPKTKIAISICCLSMLCVCLQQNHASMTLILKLKYLILWRFLPT